MVKIVERVELNTLALQYAICYLKFKEKETDKNTKYAVSRQCACKKVAHLRQDFIQIHDIPDWMLSALIVALEIVLGVLGLRRTYKINKDLAKPFLIFIFIPLTPLVALDTCLIVDQFIEPFAVRGSAKQAELYTVHEYFQAVTMMSLALCLIVFIALNLHTAFKRDVLWLPLQCLPYMVLIIFSFVWYFFNDTGLELRNYHYTAFWVLLPIHAVLLALIIFAFCAYECCLSYKSECRECADPAIIHSRSRLMWSSIYAVAATAPYWMMFVFALGFKSFNLADRDYPIAMKTMSVLEALFILFPIFMCFSTYRSALCCCPERDVSKKTCSKHMADQSWSRFSTHGTVLSPPVSSSGYTGNRIYPSLPSSEAQPDSYQEMETGNQAIGWNQTSPSTYGVNSVQLRTTGTQTLTHV